MRMLPCLTLLLASNAWALSEPMTGVALDLTGSAGIAGLPATFAPGWQASASVWAGKYDEDFAVGRGWSAGATYRQAFAGGVLLHTPLLDLRRRLDLLVLTPQLGLMVGPTFTPGATGITTEASVGVNWRMHRFYGLTAKLEGGTTLIAGTPAASVALRIGVTWARPFHAMDPV